jgi:hypothetical protein
MYEFWGPIMQWKGQSEKGKELDPLIHPPQNLLNSILNHSPGEFSKRAAMKTTFL